MIKKGPVVLTWKNNRPLFSRNGELGDGLLMWFGQTYYDDLIVPEFMCSIRLVEHNDMWSAKTKLDQLYPDTKVPDVGPFIVELKAAIKAHLDFDFGKYWSHWEREDPHFHAGVLDTSTSTWFMIE
jgi:hypothetical protein